MKIKTTRFGELDIPKECIVKFEQGMLGFTQQKKFALFPYDTDGPFFLLQAVNDPDLTFLLTDPYRFFTEYEFELEDKLAANMEFAADNPPGVYVVATLKDKLEDMTVNLVAPIVVSWKKQLAVQIIVDNKAYSIKHPLFPDGLKLKDSPADAGQGG